MSGRASVQVLTLGQLIDQLVKAKDTIETAGAADPDLADVVVRDPERMSEDSPTKVRVEVVVEPETGDLIQVSIEVA